LDQLEEDHQLAEVSEIAAVVGEIVVAVDSVTEVEGVSAAEEIVVEVVSMTVVEVDLVDPQEGALVIIVVAASHREALMHQEGDFRARHQVGDVEDHSEIS
jgi:hypothetical protein